MPRLIKLTQQSNIFVNFAVVAAHFDAQIAQVDDRCAKKNKKQLFHSFCTIFFLII